MAKTAFLFSGQGSQYTGMGVELANISAGAREVFRVGSEILGFDLLKTFSEADDKTLSQTSVAQPGIFAVSLAALAAAEEAGLQPQGVAGHSLGEYAALVCAKSLTIEEGFLVIQARAAAMQHAAEQQSGSMYAILGTDAKTIETVCERVDGYVLAVNYNSPKQTVIAGETRAVEQAVKELSGIARRCVPLKVSSAFHSKLMQPAAEEFAKALQTVQFQPPKLAFYSNLTGKRLSESADIKADLCAHLVSPVRFVDELGAMQQDGFNTFVELGPGKVLTGLVQKTLQNVRTAHIENQATLESAKQTLFEAV